MRCTYASSGWSGLTNPTMKPSGRPSRPRRATTCRQNAGARGVGTAAASSDRPTTRSCGRRALRGRHRSDGGNGPQPKRHRRAPTWLVAHRALTQAVSAAKTAWIGTRIPKTSPRYSGNAGRHPPSGHRATGRADRVRQRRARSRPPSRRGGFPRGIALHQSKTGGHRPARRDRDADKSRCQCDDPAEDDREGRARDRGDRCEGEAAGDGSSRVRYGPGSARRRLGGAVSIGGRGANPRSPGAWAAGVAVAVDGAGRRACEPVPGSVEGSSVGVVGRSVTSSS